MPTLPSTLRLPDMLVLLALRLIFGTSWLKRPVSKSSLACPRPSALNASRYILLSFVLLVRISCPPPFPSNPSA